MKPRFAPCNEYFPELTCLKSKRPSSEVITHCAFCRFLASTMVTRARASGFPPIAFTMVPAMRNVASDDWLGGAVELCAAKIAREWDNTIPHARITLRNDGLRNDDPGNDMATRYSRSTATANVLSGQRLNGPAILSHHRHAWLRDRGIPILRDGRKQAHDKYPAIGPADRTSRPGLRLCL